MNRPVKEAVLWMRVRVAYCHPFYGSWHNGQLIVDSVSVTGIPFGAVEYRASWCNNLLLAHGAVDNLSVLSCSNSTNMYEPKVRQACHVFVV